VSYAAFRGGFTVDDGASQKIAVIITFRKSNKKKLNSVSGRHLSVKQGKKHPIAAVAAATVIYIHNPVTCLVGVETFRLDQHSHINVTLHVFCNLQTRLAADLLDRHPVRSIRVIEKGGK